MKIYHSREYLIKQLDNGENYVKIARKNNVSTITIQRSLKKNNLLERRNMWDNEEILLLKENYELDEHFPKLFPNRSLNSIYHKSSRLKLKKTLRRRRYLVNHNFFKIWTHEMAYVLGWFFSDGNVSSKNYGINIHLHEKDQYILELMNRLIGSNRPINNHTNSSYLKIDSKILHKDLINLSCTPRKSLTLRFPKIKDEFLSHFIRGYFDGDGSITFNKPNTIKICFLGTKVFLEILVFKINKLLNIENQPIKNYKNIWSLYYYGDNARKICKWMYQNSEGLYLKRKRYRFNKHMKLRNEQWNINK